MKELYEKFRKIRENTFTKSDDSFEKEAIKIVKEHTRQALIEFRKECAENAATKLEDIYYQSVKVDSQYFVDKDSILSLDIEKYLK